MWHQQAKLELEVKVAELERYKEQVSEGQHVKDATEALSTQELTRVQHLVSSCMCVDCHLKNAQI